VNVANQFRYFVVRGLPVRKQFGSQTRGCGRVRQGHRMGFPIMRRVNGNGKSIAGHDRQTPRSGARPVRLLAMGKKKG
jgi:hypothetical protein